MYRKKLIFLLLALIFLSSPSIVTGAHTTSVDSFQLTNTYEQERGPLLFENNIVWQDSNGLQVYNIETLDRNLIFSKDTAIFLAAYNDKYLIYDQYFGAEDPREYDIYAVNLITGEDYEIVGGVGSQGASDIYNNEVVYTDVYYHGFGFGDLYTYDLKKNTKTFISSNAAVPRIWNNYVVWYSREGNAVFDIHAYDLANNKFIDIPNPEGANRFYPSVYNKHVVYSQIKDGVSSIHLFDLSNKQESIIVQSTTYRFGTPDISKDYIVWDKSPEIHKSGIEGFNIKTGEIFEIYPVGDQMNTRMPPRIYDNIVVWNSYRTGNGDIYGAVIRH